MKKEYVNPCMEVVKIEAQQVLAGSPDGVYQQVGGGGQLAPVLEGDILFE